MKSGSDTALNGIKQTNFKDPVLINLYDLKILLGLKSDSEVVRFAISYSYRSLVKNGLVPDQEVKK